MKIIRKPDGKQEIYDPVRKKYVALTPEEQVRQFVIGYLMNECRIPSGYISVETGLKLFDRQFRADIRVRNKMGKAVLLIECKRPSVTLDDQVLEQVMKYQLLEKERFVLFTNGPEFRCFERIPDMGGEVCWQKKDRYPDWDEINRSDNPE